MRPRTTRSIALVAALLAAGIAAAQQPSLTVDEAVAKNLEARGGLEKIESVASARIQATMTMGEMEMPVVLAWKRPDRVRVETTIQGLTRIQAFDGEVAWGYMPFAGQAAPERMPAEAVGQMQNMADFDGPLVNWQEKGHRLEMVGPDDAAGEPAWKLKLTRQGGEESFLWLDAETFLEVRQAATRSMGPDEIEVETVVGDYREVDGLLLPHAMEIRPVGGPPGAPSQTVTIESYDLGAEIPDSEFAFPAEPEGDEGG